MAWKTTGAERRTTRRHTQVQAVMCRRVAIGVCGGGSATGTSARPGNARVNATGDFCSRGSQHLNEAVNLATFPPRRQTAWTGAVCYCEFFCVTAAAAIPAYVLWASAA